jgi:hypothetical protein
MWPVAKTTLKYETGADGKLSATKHTSGKNHVEGYSMRAGCRDVDYSDVAFLKVLELHGGKGIYMEGPLMPLFPIERTKNP